MKKSIIATLLALPLAVSTAYAQDTSGVRISGFGTGALTWTNSDKAEFGRPNQASGAKKDLTTGVDSNLGLQADYTVNSWLSVTGQGLVRKDAEDDFGAELSWAFAKAKINDELSVRAGRIGLPVFMISDYRNVGYANTFLRPPVELYSQVPFKQHRRRRRHLAAQLRRHHRHRPARLRRHREAKLAGNTVEAHGLSALNLVAEHGPLTLRLGRADAKMTINTSASLNGLLAGLRATGTGYHFPQLNQLAERPRAEQEEGLLHLGRPGPGLEQHRRPDRVRQAQDRQLRQRHQRLVRDGRLPLRQGPALLHPLGTEDRQRPTNTVPLACPAGYPAACTPTLAALRGGVNTLKNSGIGQGEQTTDSIGVRWDFYRSVALKAQIDRVRPQNGTGLFLAPQAGFKGPVTVGAVALDFVF
jgi:hypothetical protein